MNKKSILVLIGVFVGLVFFTHVFAQKEKEVMKRYNFSSPKASFESLKKALKEKDIEGIVIHMWQMGKLAEDSGVYGMSFEDYASSFGEFWKDKAYEVQYYHAFNEMWPDFKITELDFVKELEREHRKEAGIGITICPIILERKSDGKQGEATAYSYDGTNEWWIFIQRGGE